MSKFLDYNPINGTWIETDYSAHEDKITVHRKQDISGLMKKLKVERNSGLNDKVGKDFHFSKYACIPPVVQVELLKKGINMHNPNQTKELIREINTNYPHLKYTNLHHE